MKAAFIGTAIVGMSVCGAGLGTVIKRFDGVVPWLSPFTIAGCVVGAIGLAIIASPLYGWKLPYVTDYRSGLLALGAVVVAKIVITQAHLAVAR